MDRSRINSSNVRFFPAENPRPGSPARSGAGVIGRTGCTLPYFCFNLVKIIGSTSVRHPSLFASMLQLTHGSKEPLKKGTARGTGACNSV